VAYQSEIEFRVKVVDQELRALERKVEKIQSRTKAVNPFSASGATKENKKALELQQRLMANEKTRLVVDKNRLQLALDLNAQRFKAINLNTSWGKALEQGRQIQLDINKAVAKEGRLRQQATAKAQAQNKGARSRKLTDIATGAGFPLLFGGGPIQALAGGLGGAAGGLGGAIAASAITAQVEAFAKEAAKVGQALNSTGGALELVREKSLFSTEQIKERAFQLEEQGRVEELAALLTDELTQLIGNEGVRSLQELGKTTSKTTKLWNELTTQLFALVSGPLDMFLKAVNDLLGRLTQGGKFSAFLGDLEPEQRSAAEARVKELQGRVGTGRSAAQGERMTLQAAQAQVLEEMGGLRPAGASIPVTKQDQRDFSVSGGRAKKDVVPGLKIQVQLQERLLGLNTKIAEARRDGNEGAAAVLEVEKIFEQTAANINKIKAEGLDKEAETLKIRSEELNGLQKVEAVNNRMRDAKAKEAEKVEELVGNLEKEGALINAKLNGTEDEVRLTQEIAEKTEGLGETDAKRVEDLIRGNAELKKQVAIADRMQQIYDQIGQSIASGVVDTLSAAVDQTKSLADAAANTLRNVANILLQLGINTALQGTGFGIFKNLSGFANGGRPPVGKPSIVGERGPELFVPNTSGTIVPNNKLGGGGSTNVVVNVDAKGSSASGDSGAGKQLGGLIGAAVQAELIKQQRPGGLLSR